MRGTESYKQAAKFIEQSEKDSAEAQLLSPGTIPMERKPLMSGNV